MEFFCIFCQHTAEFRDEDVGFARGWYFASSSHYQCPKCRLKQLRHRLEITKIELKEQESRIK